jgi:serine/threonine-protein kinase
VPLSIHVRPYAQRALLDSAEVAAGAQVVRFALRPGRVHVIRIEHPCCFPFVKELTAEEAGRIGELRVPLEPRPARLRVEGAPSTRIIVDGKELGTAGDSQRAPIDVQLPRGESPYEGSVRVELASPGAPVRTLSLKLKAGGEAVVAAPQEALPP